MDRFDELTKTLAQSTSRRQALKVLGGSLAGGLPPGGCAHVLACAVRRHRWVGVPIHPRVVHAAPLDNLQRDVGVTHVRGTAPMWTHVTIS